MTLSLLAVLTGLPMLGLGNAAAEGGGDLGALSGLGIPLSTLTPAGLLAILILLIAVGRLVPRRTMDDVIADRDEWRKAHSLSESSRTELAGMVNELLDYARTTDAYIRSQGPGGMGAQRPAYWDEPQSTGPRIALGGPPGHGGGPPPGQATPEGYPGAGPDPRGGGFSG